MADVVVVGSANLDLVVTTERHPAPGETVLGDSYSEFAGGKGLNQAVAAARCGASVAFVGAVGDDSAGQHLADVARADGIDLEGLIVVPTVPTGRAVIVVDAGGENSIVVVPGANSLVRGTTIPTGRVVIAQLEVPLDAVHDAFVAAKECGAITVLNPAPARELTDSLLARCDVIVPNEHELQLLGGIDDLHASGVTTVIVTRGASGVTLSRSGQGQVHVPVVAVPVVDTTGAGDAFCGNLAARLAAGDDMESAVRWAAAAGSVAVTVAGAVPSLPWFDDVATFLASAR